jgi:hypothetical protein
MKLYRVWNTSSYWLVVAPNEEIALDYSYKNTSTREKKNLNITSDEREGLNEILTGNRIGILIRVKTDETGFGYKWIFTISHEWIAEQLTWRR